MAANGFEALKDLDSNVDGVIDAKDSAFTTLRLWRDLNSNGVTDAGELQTLEQANVRNLNVGYTSGNQKDAEGNHHRQLGSFTKGDGRQQKMNDVWFSVDTARTVNMNLLAVSEQIDALPDLLGMGNVASLHQAMARDSTGTLTKLVQQWISAGEAERPALLTSLIFHWAGVQNIDPTSRAATKIYGNVIGDARKLATLEKILGKNYMGVWCWGELDPNPHGRATPHLLKAFDLLAQRVKERLQWQSDFRPFVNSLALHWDEASASFEWDVSKLVEVLKTQFNRGEASSRLAGFDDALISTGSDGISLMNAISKAIEQQDGDFETWLLLGRGALLLGTEGADTLQVNNFMYKSHLLRGGAGDDTLRGGAGADMLSGDNGNDSLAGGSGSDIYLFNQGDGNDTINDEDYTSGDIDTLQLGAGLNAANTVLARSGNDLTLTWGSESVSLQNYFYSAYYKIEKIVFADGTTWADADIATKLTQTGTIGNDNWSGLGNQSNRMFGLAGNDQFYGGQLEDTLDGGDGNDSLTGYAGNDNLIGGNGNDSLDGGAGSDSLSGGKGNDRLVGGSGNDIYLFNQGDGNDTINDEDYTSGNIDTLRLGASLIAANTVLARSGNDLSLTWGSDSVSLQNYFYSAYYKIEKIVFADGATWANADIATKLTQTGTIGNDNWSGFDNQSNRMFGLAGDDQFYGGQLEDTLDGGDGNDSLTGYAGNDNLIGGNGNDYLDGGAGSDSLIGGNGNDSLDGGAGSDSLSGGKGNDRLIGGSGNDIYLFNQGDGNDTINDEDYTSGNIDTLQLGAGLIAANTVLARSGNDLTLTWGSESVSLQNYFYSAYCKIEKIVFADGTTWANADITTKLTQTGTIGNDSWWGFDNQSNRMFGLAGNDQLYGGQLEDTLDGGDGNDSLTGYAGNDNLIGGNGNDYLDGGAGSDSLSGGKGNDRLVGGDGNDVYRFNRGDGVDTVIDADATQGNIDILELTDINQQNLWFQHIGDDLQIDILGSFDQIIVKGWYSQNNWTGPNHLELIKTAEGYTMNDSDVEHFVQAMAAFSAPPASQSSWNNGQHYNGRVLLTVTH